MPYKRVLLKLSGEALSGQQGYGIEPAAMTKVCQALGELIKQKHQVAIVIGGGNIYRGLQGYSQGMERTSADQMGMLATIMNGIALQQALESAGFSVRLMSALDCPAVADRYRWDIASSDLSSGKILIFVGGTGHPYFTTDTTAALRACEMHADILLKATMHVDGIYTKDPRRFADAKKYETITYREILDQKLGILDLTAVTLCMTSQIPIRVFNFNGGSLLEAVSDLPFGTLVKGN